MPNIRPLSDRVLVRRLETQDKTPGGILLPDNAKEKPQRGKVLAVGPGRLDAEGKRVTMDVKKGDVVLFTTYAGSHVPQEAAPAKKGEAGDLLIMREEDILGILE